MRISLALAATALAVPLAAQPAPANPNIISPPLSPTTPGAAAGPTDTGRPRPATATTVNADPAVGAAGVPPRSGIGKRLRRPR